MSSAASSFISVANMHPHNHWISSLSVTIIETRKTLSASEYFNNKRRSLGRRVLTSLTDYQEHCWTEKAQLVEKTFKMWITAHPYHSSDRLVRETLVLSKQLWERVVLLFTDNNVELNNMVSILVNSSVNHLVPNYYKCHHIPLSQAELSHFTLFIQFCD